MLHSSSTKHRKDIQRDIDRIKAALADTAYDVKDTAYDMITDSIDIAKEKSLETSKKLSKLAHRKPFYVLGAGFISGVLMSWFLKRR